MICGSFLHCWRQPEGKAPGDLPSRSRPADITAKNHKLTILKGGIRKLNQAPYKIKGFRLFDKVRCNGETGFIFGRRASGYFDVSRLDGTRISAGISLRKLRLLEKRRTFLTEIRNTEDGNSSPA